MAWRGVAWRAGVQLIVKEGDSGKLPPGWGSTVDPTSKDRYVRPSVSLRTTVLLLTTYYLLGRTSARAVFTAACPVEPRRHPVGSQWCKNGMLREALLTFVASVALLCQS